MKKLIHFSLVVTLFTSINLNAQTTFLNKNVPITKLSCDSLLNEEEFKVKFELPANAAKFDRLEFRCLGRMHYVTKEQFQVYFENKKDTTFYIIGSKSPFALSTEGPSSVCFKPLLAIADSTFETVAHVKGQMLLGTSSQYNSASGRYENVESWDQGKILSETKLMVWYKKKKKKK